MRPTPRPSPVADPLPSARNDHLRRTPLAPLRRPALLAPLAPLRRLARLTPLALLACRPAPAQSLPICPVHVAADRAAEADTRQLPPVVWAALLVPGFDRTTRTVPDAPRDCSRAALEPPPGALPPRPLADDDLSFGTSNDAAAELLVWARILALPDGTAFGPVALVRWTDRGLEIRGVGPLHAPARRARLRLERLADGQRLLVAEGETCPEGQAPPCPREAVLLPLRGQRFTPTPLVEGPRPPRPARLRLDERRDITGPDGASRRLEIHRRLDLRGAPEIRATLRLRDCKTPDACTDHLSLDDARPLEIAGESLVTPDDPWLAFLHQHQGE